MLFSSMLFLWVFLPLVIIGNYVLGLIPFSSVERQIRCKNVFLLLSSLFFYAWGGIYYLLLMAGIILVNYLGGIFMGRSCTPKGRKGILVLSVLLNLSVLFFFKYFNMMIAMLETVLALGEKNQQNMNFWECFFTLQGTGQLGIEKIFLPIGISFFTFQAMSYAVDVYRGTTSVQKGFIDFALYVALFPQLIAGPIVQYADVAEQIRFREESRRLFLAGQKRFCYGLAKKVLIANPLGEVADQIWGLKIGGLGAGTAWLGAISYTLQIYYDFSGYSDMAIGLGRMFGFRFKENFHYPYTALSIQDFWRRWHISLSSWFKNYVYIPLGGNRRGLIVTCRNLLLVFLLTGIWHGANFTFLLWGLGYALLLIVERLFLGKLLEKNPLKLLNRIYVLFIVMLAWILFRSDNILIAGEYIRQLLTFGSSEYSILSYLSMQVLLALILGILGSGFLQKWLKKPLQILSRKQFWQDLAFLYQIALLVVSILLLVAGTYNPFIYFQF